MRSPVSRRALLPRERFFAGVVGPGDIRCDSQVGVSAGCVNSAFPAIVTMSMSNPVNGQAVAGYDWAQTELPDVWGTEGHELHVDRANADANRGRAVDGDAYLLQITA